MKNYEDIIRLPHPVSAKHRQMPIADRAAQFMPFAALTGYEAALAETARLTSPRIEPDETQRELLDRQLSFLQSLAAENAGNGLCAASPASGSERLAQLQITVTYFCPDAKKEGGTYRTASGIFQKVDPYAQLLYLSPEHRAIPLADILRIDGACFSASAF